MRWFAEAFTVITVLHVVMVVAVYVKTQEEGKARVISQKAVMLFVDCSIFGALMLATLMMMMGLYNSLYVWWYRTAM